jgi:predicted nucleic-acid-binding Zn-ribbon protein
MDRIKLSGIITALNSKSVTQPCPRCASKNFSIVGESEIIVTQPPSGGLLGLANLPSKTTMPIIIISCDNCGFIAQHAQAALNTPTKTHNFSL